MTPVQAAAIARADAAMKPALDLYAERCKAFRGVCLLELRDLKRLNQVIAALSHDDLRQVAAFAEVLAEWGGGAASSLDGQLPASR